MASRGVLPGSTARCLPFSERPGTAGDRRGGAPARTRATHFWTPTVGDWVVVEDGSVTVLLERHSAIVRASAGNGDKPQVLAANVDKVFVVTSLEGAPVQDVSSGFSSSPGRAAPPR